MFKINLVPEVQEKKLQLKRINTFSTIFAISLLSICGLILLIIGGVDIAKKTELASNQKKITEVKAESEQYLELEKTVISLEKGLAGIKQISDGTNNWTKLLPHLENATPRDVKYKTLKILSGAAEGTIECKSVDSLAKFIESYKNYQVIVLSGPGVEGDSVNVSIDGSTPTLVNVKSNGQWLFAVNFDPAKNHEIKVEAINTNSISIKYDASTKGVSSTNESVIAIAKLLYSNVETKEYTKGDKGDISFDVKFNFDTSSLW